MKPEILKNILLAALIAALLIIGFLSYKLITKKDVYKEYDKVVEVNQILWHQVDSLESLVNLLNLELADIRNINESSDKNLKQITKKLNDYIYKRPQEPKIIKDDSILVELKKRIK